MTRPDADSPPGTPGLPRLAFLGLGALGSPMAANLLRAGYPLALHNRTPGRGPAPQLETATAADAVTGAEVVCLCLSDDAAVEAVLLGGEAPADRGLLAVLAEASLVIDFSTISPATSRRLAGRLAERGVGYLDAPVTGGTEGARAGRLSVLVGGSEADLERARPVLEVVGARITHVGEVGSGQQAKAVNQVLVAGSYGAVAEAMALGSRLGLPMPAVVEALRCGAAGSWALEHRSSQMLNGEFPLGFRLALHRKDLAIALEAAAAVQLELPLTRRVAAMEDELMARGHADADVSALALWFNP